MFFGIPGVSHAVTQKNCEMPSIRKGGQWTSQRHQLHVLLPNLQETGSIHQVCLKARKACCRRRSRNSLDLGAQPLVGRWGHSTLWPGAEGKETREEEEGAPGTALFVNQTAPASVLHGAGCGIARTSSQFEG